MIRRWLRRWFSLRVAHRDLTPVIPIPRSPTPPPPPEAEPYVPMTEAERIVAGELARAERAEMIAAQVRVNQFEDPPEVCAARAADPAWRAEQVAKREAASEAFVRYRNQESGLPLVVKGRY